VPNLYCTASDLARALGIPDAVDDFELELAVSSASRAIDDACGRFFYQVGTESTPAVRVFDAAAPDRTSIDDVVSVTTVKLDTALDGTYGHTYAAGDWFLEPYQPQEGWPYTAVRLRPTARRFLSYRQAVQVTGVFGWPSVPPQVEQACLMQAARWFKRVKEAPFGIAGMPAYDGSGIRLMNKLDPDVEVLLSGVRRFPALVG
jgi:hypothetical protein